MLVTFMNPHSKGLIFFSIPLLVLKFMILNDIKRIVVNIIIIITLAFIFINLFPSNWKLVIL